MDFSGKMSFYFEFVQMIDIANNNINNNSHNSFVRINTCS